MVEKLKREDCAMMVVVTVVALLGFFAATLMFWKGYNEAPLPAELAIFFYPMIAIILIFAALGIILIGGAAWMSKWPPFKFMENWK